MSDHESALFVQPGVKAVHDGMEPMKRRKFVKKRKPVDIEQLATDVKSGSKLHLAKAITLLESSNLEDKVEGQSLLKTLLSYTGKSIRIGITGVFLF